GGYLSPACGGGKITSTQFFLIDKGILQWCAKGMVTIFYAITADVIFSTRSRRALSAAAEGKAVKNGLHH
ncbi:hypothetical protein, partial [uncultured Ruminococcus sp.]|uniref:hypothetical protein n=1 Tax=uncultured Ruminococcus sp. TaxID=165186 RepID=UPI0025F2E46C